VAAEKAVEAGAAGRRSRRADGKHAATNKKSAAACAHELGCVRPNERRGTRHATQTPPLPPFLLWARTTLPALRLSLHSHCQELRWESGRESSQNRASLEERHKQATRTRAQQQASAESRACQPPIAVALMSQRGRAGIGRMAESRGQLTEGGSASGSSSEAAAAVAADAHDVSEFASAGSLAPLLGRLTGTTPPRPLGGDAPAPRPPLAAAYTAAPLAAAISSAESAGPARTLACGSGPYGGAALRGSGVAKALGPSGTGLKGAGPHGVVTVSQEAAGMGVWAAGRRACEGGRGGAHLARCECAHMRRGETPQQGHGRTSRKRSYDSDQALGTRRKSTPHTNVVWMDLLERWATNTARARH